MKALILFIILVAFFGCKSSNVSKRTGVDNTAIVPQYTPGPAAMVYKTKNDYNNLVPVLLSDDKSEIVSYPHPTDLLTDSGYAVPATLNSGYLLDNRGIGKNVAFLKLTYEEYSKLQNPPSLKELYNYILDKDPLVELCNCGNKKAFKDIEKQLNDLIDRKELRTTCKVIR